MPAMVWTDAKVSQEQWAGRPTTAGTPFTSEMTGTVMSTSAELLDLVRRFKDVAPVTV
jgi:hypothetical protein